MRSILLLGIVLALGCSGGGSAVEWPPLHPVKGTVSLGGKPVAGGLLQFQPEAGGNPDFLISSVVSPDGSFTLATSHVHDKSGSRKTGAPAGKYKLTFTPAIGDQTAGGGSMMPILLPQPVVVDSKENDLKIELPAPKKK